MATPKLIGVKGFNNDLKTKISESVDNEMTVWYYN